MNENSLKKIMSNENFYLNILKKNPNNYDAILNLGLIDVKKRNLLSAKNKFKKLLIIDKKK